MLWFPFPAIVLLVGTWCGKMYVVVRDAEEQMHLIRSATVVSRLQGHPYDYRLYHANIPEVI